MPLLAGSPKPYYTDDEEITRFSDEASSSQRAVVNKKVRRIKPKFECWNFATPQSALRIFQGIGAIACLCLIGSVGSQFSPTYGAMVSSSLGGIGSLGFLLCFVFDLHKTTRKFEWIYWEILFTGSLSFLFIVNTLTMSYSSIRWEHTAWYLAAIFCVLVTGSYIMDTYLSVKLLIHKPSAKHSQDYS